MPVGDLVAFNRQTLQSYSNLGWQSTSDTQTGELESGVATLGATLGGRHRKIVSGKRRLPPPSISSFYRLSKG
jgi:hypothetical protein